MSFFNYFTDRERGAVQRAAELKNKAFGWLGPALVRLHVHPDALSYMGLALLCGVVIWFMAHPFRAVFLLFLYILVDGMDGAYARYLDRPTQSGAFTDIVADQMGMVVVALGFIHYGMVDGEVGAYYIMIYLVMITFSVVQNAQGIPMQYIFRSKYFLYGIYAFWAFTRVNLAPVFLPAFCVVMTVSVAQSYLRLKRGFYWKYDFPELEKKDRAIREQGGEPPRFYPSLNFILPAFVVAFLVLLGGYTQLVALLERPDLRPAWKLSNPLPLMTDRERPRALAAWKDGLLLSAYDPETRFTRIYFFQGDSMALRGLFRVPFPLHPDHGACSEGDRLYLADRGSARVYEIDLQQSLERGIAALERSFATTLNAPVACAVIPFGQGSKAMLVSEYMNRYLTIVVDHEKAFVSGSAAPALLGWYRNSGFSLGLAHVQGRVLEMNSSLGRDLIYAIDLPAALKNHYLRSGIRAKLASPRFHARGLAAKPGRMFVVDGKTQRVYSADLPLNFLPH